MSDDRQSYYEEARHWAAEAEVATRRQNGILRALIVALIVIVVVQAIALVELMPLKSVETLPILVDRHSGYVQVLNADGRQTLRADEALTRSLLAQYVTLRENYDAMTLAYDYKKVALFSAGEARDAYVASMPASNPQSPLRKYSRTTLVETRIDSVSEIGPRTAMVRFQTRRRDQNGAASNAEAWVAIVSYRYTDALMSVSDRLLNPLGFQVVRYRKDPEALAPPLPPPPAPSLPPPLADAAAPADTTPGAPVR